MKIKKKRMVLFSSPSEFALIAGLGSKVRTEFEKSSLFVLKMK